MAIRLTQQDKNTSDDAADPGVAGERLGRPKRARRAWIASCIGALVMGASGCGSITTGVNRAIKDAQECIDESMVDYRNRAMAEKAWIRVRHHYSHHQNHRNFRDGFISGYMDVAAGGDGCTPAIAPSEYWGWKYQSPSGQTAMNAWFEGYPLGAKAAEEDGIGHWQSIRVNLGTPYGSPAAGMHGGFGHELPYPIHFEEHILPAPQPERPFNDSSLSDPSFEVLPSGGTWHLNEASRQDEGRPTESLNLNGKVGGDSGAFAKDLFETPIGATVGAESDELSFSFE